MTPSDIITSARDLYNASGDSFFADTQLYNWIWQGCHEFARKAWLIEATSTQNTVAGQQSYSYPTNALALKRVTVNGRKIKRVTGREDDAVTLSNQTATTMGWPSYYRDWNYTIYLRSIPDGVYSLGIDYYSDQPQITTGTDTLLIPVVFHFDLVDYLLWRMYAKDQNLASASAHAQLWQEHVKDAKSHKARLKRTDSFATVQSEDTLPVNILGEA